MRNFIWLTFLFISIFSFGQKVADADVFFKDKKYKKAADIYETFLKRSPKNPSLNYKYGACIWKLGKQEQALPYLQFAAEKNTVEANQYIGEYYFSNYRFEEAYLAFEKISLSENLSDKEKEAIATQMGKADMGRRMLTNVEDITIVDSILVDKERFFKQYDLHAEAGEIISASDFFNKAAKSNLPGHLSERKDRFFYADSTQNQLDIFATYKLYDGWSVPQYVSEQINTKANESYPFMMDDGVTLYFASDRKSSLGGYDIFVTRYNQNTNDFLPPENVGMPFNSIYNEYLLAIDEHNNLGWFATDRFQRKNKVMIYVFILNAQKQRVKEENYDYLGRLASLRAYKKQYRLIIKKEIPNLIEKEGEYVLNNDSIRFVVNDSLVYHSMNDFRSDEARALFQMGVYIANELDSLSLFIERKRQDYIITETPENKRAIMVELLSLELKINDLQRKKKEVDLHTRNVEIKKIQNSLQ